MIGNKLTLSSTERQTIDSILNEAEREFFDDGESDHAINMLDQKSRKIWDDWDYSNMSPSKKSDSPTKDKAYVPFSQTIMSKLSNSKESVNENTEISSDNSDDENLNEKSYKLPKSSLIREIPSKISKSIREQQKKTRDTEMFSKYDVIRLKQENNELKARMSKLQSALDRSYSENERMKTELDKTKRQLAKQNSLISALKEQKLYGKH